MDDQGSNYPASFPLFEATLNAGAADFSSSNEQSVEINFNQDIIESYVIEIGIEKLHGEQKIINL